MIEIKDLLSKFNNLLFSEEVKVQALIKVLNEVVNIKLKREDIKIKNNIIHLNIKPIYKNEIFLNQEKILLLLQENIGKKSPKIIR
mgnify:CR=1 FL=1